MHSSLPEVSMQWSVWVHSRGDKEALVVHPRSGYVGVVYDRVDDPHGPTAQYYVQWLTWEEFWRTHQLKAFYGWLN
jgi:hypothetical protein